MYIKQVIIEGFKSYKDQLISDNFSPKINCVVGANGSGKSNFFHAIRFVLSDIFTNLRQEDRVKLLHEGAGNHVLSAYVEVVFDNTDNRFPVDRDEVRLRRTIGVKKDEYFLDKKHITKAEVMNFLESAGFSRANPYYVVQQGKIMKMSTMKDSERLDLLKEIGGTKVYEERRRESLKIMQENEIRKNQIQEVVDQLDGKLGELDAERDELHKYQQLDKQRRGLEYALYDKELADARKKLEDVEQQRSQVSKAAGQRQDQADRADEELRTMQEELRTTKTALKDSKEALRVQREHKQEALEAKTRLAMDVKDLQERLSMQTSSAAEAEQELQGLQAEISQRQTELNRCRSSLEQTEEAERNLEHEAAEANRRQQFLYGKQGQNFGSKAEKDAWMSKKIKEAQRVISKDAEASQGIAAQAQAIEQQLVQLEQEDTEMDDAGGDAEAAQCEQELAASKAKANGLQNRRKDLWREETALESKRQQLSEELTRKERQLHNAVSYDINNGLKSARKVVEENRIKGVHGTLIELLQCDPKLHTAVEVAAGNRLFNYVVDNEEVAASILQRMKHIGKNSGRVTLMPLANLHTPSITYPTEFGSNAVPMMKKLKYDAALQPAVQQIFGKLMICRDLEVANQVSRSTNFDSITLDGDRVDNKGPITGGYHDDRFSKMDAMKGVKDIVGLLEECRASQKAMADELQGIDQEITQCMGEQQRLQARLTHLRGAAEQRRTDERKRQRHAETLRQQLEGLRRQASDCRRRMAEGEAKVASLQQELGSELLSQLSREEQEEVARISARLQQLKEELKGVQTSRLQGQVAVQELESLLSGNLQQRQQELQDQLACADLASEGQQLQQLRADAELAATRLQDAIATEAEIATKTDHLKRQSSELKRAVEGAVAARESEAEEAQEQEALLDTLISKRTQYSQRRDDVAKKIRELGSLPTEAFERYRGKGTKELHRLLKGVGDELKQYSHVNKKALEQYITFTEQREDLLKRQAELQSGEGKIRELVAALDLRKDEAIERTFKGVAKHFREIFAELAPGGRGELVMQKRLNVPNAPGAEEDEADDAMQGSALDIPEAHEKYSGVKVRVSFGMGEVQTMQQLSGGQKTMVALTLIFAIQRCDPAPFYLFDEIDAALDSQYRTTVARMLEKQMDDVRNPAQFIVTTFHAQIVNVADKVYGVTHNNRVSQVDVINRDEALEFLSSEETQRQDEPAPAPAPAPVPMEVE